jgi:hypothetical protein
MVPVRERALVEVKTKLNRELSQREAQAIRNTTAREFSSPPRRCFQAANG